MSNMEKDQSNEAFVAEKPVDKDGQLLLESGVDVADARGGVLAADVLSKILGESSSEPVGLSEIDSDVVHPEQPVDGDENESGGDDSERLKGQILGAVKHLESRVLRAESLKGYRTLEEQGRDRGKSEFTKQVIDELARIKNGALNMSSGSDAGALSIQYNRMLRDLGYTVKTRINYNESFTELDECTTALSESKVEDSSRLVAAISDLKQDVAELAHTGLVYGQEISMLLDLLSNRADGPILAFSLASSRDLGPARAAIVEQLEFAIRIAEQKRDKDEIRDMARFLSVRQKIKSITDYLK